jgi:S1-C subfamily serine protease
MYDAELSRRNLDVKKTAVFCLLSGLAGAVVAGLLQRMPDPTPVSVAQEPYSPPAPAMPGPAASPGSPFELPPPPGMRAPSVRGSPGFPVPPSRLAPNQLPDDLTPEEYVNIAVYENCNRGVVNISTKGSSGEKFLWIDIPASGEGSGIVIDRQGHLLTNFHVVEGAREIQVTLFNRKSYDATVVGKDLINDVAVLRIEAPPGELFPIVFGDSSNLRVGQRVFAIGDPFGLERTLTTGIISSLDRWIPSRQKNRRIKQIIQVDAAINPGNSGGPLLDSHGRLIGMNTAIASSTGDSAGVGFAIPINTIARVVPALISGGRVIRPEAGIERVYKTEHGLLILTLTPGGPAERAGLRGARIIRQMQRYAGFPYPKNVIDTNSADLITAVDGQPIKTPDDFLSAVESRRPGDAVVVAVVRGGQQFNVRVQLEAASE